MERFRTALYGLFSVLVSFVIIVLCIQVRTTVALSAPDSQGVGVSGVLTEPLQPHRLNPEGSSLSHPLSAQSAPGIHGYTFRDSREPGEPVYNWKNISTSGELITPFLPDDDDGYTQPVTITGFAFPFYTSTYTQVYISSNAVLSFGSGYPEVPGNMLPHADPPNNAIIPFGSDMKIGPDTHIYTRTETTPIPHVIIEFSGMELVATPGVTVTFETLLYENGNILVQYQTVDEAIPPAVAGLENNDGSEGISYPTSNITNELAVLYYAPGQSPPDFRTSTMTASPVAGFQGDVITITLALTNTGSMTATHLILSNPIPDNTSFVAGSAQGAVVFRSSLNRMQLHPSFSTLSGGATITGTYQLSLDTVLPCASTITSTATVAYQELPAPEVLTTTVAIDCTPNLTPILSVPLIQTVLEDTDLRVGNIIIGDPDAGNNPVQVRLSTLNGGFLTIPITDDLTFVQGDGKYDTMMMFTGTLAAINKALRDIAHPANNLTYRGASNYHGEDVITIEVNDQGYTGVGGPLTAVATIPVMVVSVPDTPQFTSTLPPCYATQGVLFSYTITARDGDPEDTLSLTAAAIPPWMTFTDYGNGQAILWGVPSGISGQVYQELRIDLRDSSGLTPVVTQGCPSMLNPWMMRVSEKAADIRPISFNIAEGSQTKYYVKLNSPPPGGNVTLKMYFDERQIDVTPSELTFTSSNWNTDQPVTINVRTDGLLEPTPHTTIISHHVLFGFGYGSDVKIDLVNVSIQDNDTPGISITEQPGGTTVPEGDRLYTTYQLRLTSQPAARVTIHFDTDNQIESIDDVFFEPGNWTAVKTINVRAKDDDIDEPSPHTGIIKHTVESADPIYAAVSLRDVSVSIYDNDEKGVIVTPLNISATEGGDCGTYSVKLGTEPTGPVTLSFLPNTELRSPTPAPVTFNATDWNTWQTITVCAVNDDRAEQSTSWTTLSHTVSGGNYTGVSVPSVVVTITDNDSPGLKITEQGGTAVTEDGSSDTYTITLTSQPTSTVTVEFMLDTVQLQQTAPLTFTTNNWNRPRQVTVRSVDDKVAEGMHSSAIVHRVSSNDPNYNGKSDWDVIVDITDNDTPGVNVSPTDLQVTEGGSVATYQVSLTSKPIHPVTVMMFPGTQIKSIAPVVIQTDQWNQSVLVSVEAVDDTLKERIAPHHAIINHSVSSSDPAYNGIGNIHSVDVAITDNDSEGVLIEPTTISAEESGLSGRFNVRLTKQPDPGTTVIVTAIVDANQVQPIDPLTFDDGNWNYPQPVDVEAVDDERVEGNHISPIRFRATVNGAPYNVVEPISSVTVNIADDDAPYIIVSPSTLTVQEGKQTSYTILLGKQPTGDVIISFDTGNQLCTIPPQRFTTADWNVPKTITMCATDDGVEDGTQQATITHRAYGGGYDGANEPAITVTVTDPPPPPRPEPAQIVIESPTLYLYVGDPATTYSVVLRSQPTADVRITLRPSSSAVRLSTTELVFTRATWNIPQPVSVEGALPGQTIITHVPSSADTRYQNLLPQDVTATVHGENDPGVRIDPVVAHVAEGGADDTYTIRLNTQPTDNVTLEIVPNAQIQPIAPVTFTPSTWNIPRTVRVVAVDDDDEEGRHTTFITHRSSSNDTNYKNMSSLPQVQVNITDNDMPGIIITESGGSTRAVEGIGSGDTYTMTLTEQPNAPVTVSVMTSTQVVASPPVIVFSPDTWNTPAVVTVQAVDDSTAEGKHTGIITHTVSSSDSVYNGIMVNSVVVDITDNDVPAVVVLESNGQTMVGEGGTTDTYQMVLTQPPTQTVTVDIITDTVQVHVAPPSLTFTTDTWNQLRTITVEAVDDGLGESSPHASTILHETSSADTTYQNIDVDAIVAGILDNDSGVPPPPPGSLPDNCVGFDKGGVFEVDEDAGVAEIYVVFKATTVQTATVSYYTFDDTAVAPDDYTPISGTLTFAPGQQARPFYVPINNNQSDLDGDKSLYLALHNYSADTVPCDNNVAVLTIRDTTPDQIGEGFVRLSKRFYTTDEAQGGATITVTRDKGSTGTFVVRYDTFDGTAKARYNSFDGDAYARVLGDYGTNGMRTSGLITFEPGETVKTFTVPINADDGLIEGDETIILQLSNALWNGTPADDRLINSQATLIINDADVSNTSEATAALTQFIAENTRVSEGGKTATIPIQRTGSTTQPITVAYTTFEASATPGFDYTPVSGTIFFAAGQSMQKITIPIVDDTLDQGNHVIGIGIFPVEAGVSLQQSTGNPLVGSQSEIFLTIVDNDATAQGTVQFSSPVYYVSEDGKRVVIAIERVGGDDDEIQVRYSLADASAHVNTDTDEAISEGILTLKDGEKRKTFTIDIQQDDFPEGDESLFLVLEKVSDAGGEGVQRTALLLLPDDEDPTDPASVYAYAIEGVLSNIITATVRDANNDPVSSGVVSFTFTATADPELTAQNPACTSENVVINPSQTTPDPLGIVTATLRITSTLHLCTGVVAVQAATAKDLVEVEFAPSVRYLPIVKTLPKGVYPPADMLFEADPTYTLGGGEEATVKIQSGYFSGCVGTSYDHCAVEAGHTVVMTATTGCFVEGSISQTIEKVTDIHGVVTAKLYPFSCDQIRNQASSSGATFLSDAWHLLSAMLVPTTQQAGGVTGWSDVQATLRHSGGGVLFGKVDSRLGFADPNAIAGPRIDSTPFSLAIGASGPVKFTVVDNEGIPVAREYVTAGVEGEGDQAITINDVPTQAVDKKNGFAPINIQCQAIGTAKVNAVWTDENGNPLSSPLPGSVNEATSEYIQCGTAKDMDLTVKFNGQPVGESTGEPIATLQADMSQEPPRLSANVQPTDLKNAVKNQLITISRMGLPRTEGFVNGSQEMVFDLTNDTLEVGDVDIVVRAGEKHRKVRLHYDTVGGCNDIEGNNDRANAKDMLIDKACDGTLDDDDPNAQYVEDNYKFKLSRRSQVRIWLRDIAEGANYDLQLGRWSGKGFAKSKNELNRNEYLDIILEPDTYYLQVFQQLPSSGANHYTLAIRISPNE